MGRTFVHRLLCLVATACGLLAQTESGSSGWSQQDSLRGADAIVIGQVISGSGSDGGATVDARAVLRVRRVIKGAVVPETDLRLAWSYSPTPAEGPDVTGRVPPLYGLWLLRGEPGAAWRPLPAAAYVPSLGGVCLELPRTELNGDFFYPGDAPADVRLARELGAALEAIAVDQGDRLNSARRSLPDGGWSGRVTPAQARFQQISSLLALAGRAATLPVYTRFAASPQPNLRAVGIAGLLRSGDIDALFALERDAPALAPTLEAVEIAHSLGAISLDRHLAAMHALGRTALGETEMPNLEGAAAFRLGWARSVEALPYLAAMLASPNPYTRGQAVVGICTAVRSAPPAPLAGAWREEMGRYCPSSLPVRDPAVEQAAVRFWLQWWAGQRKKLEEAAPLAEVRPPARYRAARAQQAPRAIEVPMEERFYSLMTMTSSSLSLQSRGTPLAARLSPADDEKLAAAARRTAGALDAHQRAALAVMGAARVRGAMPAVEDLRKLEEERKALLRDALAELRRELSPLGWEVVERFMLDMNIQAVPLGGR